MSFSEYLKKTNLRSWNLAQVSTFRALGIKGETVAKAAIVFAALADHRHMTPTPAQFAQAWLAHDTLFQRRSSGGRAS